MYLYPPFLMIQVIFYINFLFYFFYYNMAVLLEHSKPHTVEKKNELETIYKFNVYVKWFNFKYILYAKRYILIF